MKKKLTAAAIVVFASMAAATPARASSICDVDPQTSYYAWFAHTFGYCNS